MRCYVLLYISLYYLYSYICRCYKSLIFWFPIFSNILSLSFLIVLLSIMNGFDLKFKNDDLKFIPHAIITNSDYYINSKSILFQKFYNLINIKSIEPIIMQDVILQSQNKTCYAKMLTITTNSVDPILNFLNKKKYAPLINGKYRIIIGNNLAKRMMVHCGDYLKIITLNNIKKNNKEYIPNQRLFNIVNIFKTNSEVDDYQILVNQFDASNLLGYKNGFINGWRLWLNDPINDSKLCLSKELIYHDWRESHGEIFRAMCNEKNVIILLFTIMLFISIVSILSSFIIFIINKKNEIAILQTQGLTRSYIIFIFFIKILFLNLISNIIGVLLGIFLSKKINIILSNLSFITKILISLPIYIKISQIIFLVFLLNLITIIFSVYFLSIITLINISKILSYE